MEPTGCTVKSKLVLLLQIRGIPSGGNRGRVGSGRSTISGRPRRAPPDPHSCRGCQIASRRRPARTVVQLAALFCLVRASFVAR